MEECISWTGFYPGSLSDKSTVDRLEPDIVRTAAMIRC